MDDWFGPTTRTPRSNALMSLPDYGYGPITPTTQGGRQNAMMTAVQEPQRPNDYLAPVAEAISPTMGAYGTGQAAAELSRAVGNRDWKQAAEIGLPMLAMFAGPGARTANKGMLAKAQQMASEGIPRERIWNDTGWFTGADGKWRWEIDDSKTWMPYAEGMRIFEDGPVREVISHQKLEDAYPRVMNRTAEVDINPRRQQNAGVAYMNGNIAVVSPSVANARSLMLHELQHQIQGKERFSPGGSPAEFNGLNDESSQYAMYLRLAGEVEARTVQNRMNLSADERRARAPWLDYDIPESDQIVKNR
jgi:hypothetical protein